MDKNSNIVIVGLGVVGGSYAFALKKCGYNNVYGIDCDSETIEKAIKMGIIKEGCTEGKHLLRTADLVVIALYPKQIYSFIKDNKECFKSGCIITDVAGIKEHFIEDIQQILPAGVDFIFCHPMAGREKKGIDYASDNVFVGANFIITPTKTNKECDLLMIENLVKEMGFKSVKRITPSQHDEIIGFTSQLPHALAVALVNSDVESRDTGSFIGDSYRDLTRIANINENLWAELFLGNKDNLLESIVSFERCLDDIKDALKENDEGKLKEIFIKATARRIKLDKK